MSLKKYLIHFNCNSLACPAEALFVTCVFYGIDGDNPLVDWMKPQTSPNPLGDWGSNPLGRGSVLNLLVD